MWISINPKIAVIDFAVQNMNRILKAHKAGAVEGRDASIFAIKKHPLGESQLINFCHQTPGRRFVFDLKNSNLGFFHSLLFCFFLTLKFLPQENQRLNRQVLEMRRELKAPHDDAPRTRRSERLEPRRRESKVFGKDGPDGSRCWTPRQRCLEFRWDGKNQVLRPKMFGGMLWIEFNFVVS